MVMLVLVSIILSIIVIVMAAVLVAVSAYAWKEQLGDMLLLTAIAWCAWLLVVPVCVSSWMQLGS